MESWGNMEVRYIQREQIRFIVKRLKIKYKGKYKYSAKAEAPLYTEDISDVSTTSTARFSTNTNRDPVLVSELVYSKTEQGAKTSALTSLLHKCRAPLTRKQKIQNKKLSKINKPQSKRYVSIEVRVSQSFDFIMNTDGETALWQEILK